MLRCHFGRHISAQIRRNRSTRVLPEELIPYCMALESTIKSKSVGSNWLRAWAPPAQILNTADDKRRVATYFKTWAHTPRPHQSAPSSSSLATDSHTRPRKWPDPWPPKTLSCPARRASDLSTSCGSTLSPPVMPATGRRHMYEIAALTSSAAAEKRRGRGGGEE